MEHLLQYVFDLFEMPAVGLPAVFLSALISATLIPIGSEPILFGYVSLNPNLFWVAILVAALGNTAGGMIDWWLGLIARNTFDALKESKPAEDRRLKRWLIKRGPVMLLFAWLPIVGDPLCVAAGWLRLAWLPCLLYMFIGKLFRFVVVTWLLKLIPASFWHQLGVMLHQI